VTHGRRSFLVALAALAVAHPARARSPYPGRPEVQQFVDELVTAHGFDRARLERWLRDARYSASVERLMQPPIPFGQRNWLEYRQRYLDPRASRLERTFGRRTVPRWRGPRSSSASPPRSSSPSSESRPTSGASPATSGLSTSSRR
jgi:hypothetical protein